MAVRQRRSNKSRAWSAAQKTPVVMEEDSSTLNMEVILNALRRQPLWIVLAVSSGACAALNGVFAKLTTTALTSDLSSHIATFLSLASDNKIVDVAVRGFFFGMNLLFNAAMWALFTTALTRADSTTRVSIVNVSANFMITAILGWLIFGEKLPPLWWLGAGFLAAGNVVIGRREKGDKPGGTVGLDETREEAEALLSEAITVREGNLVELNDAATSRRSEEQSRIRRGEDVDSPI